MLRFSASRTILLDYFQFRPVTNLMWVLSATLQKNLALKPRLISFLQTQSALFAVCYQRSNFSDEYAWYEGMCQTVLITFIKNYILVTNKYKTTLLMILECFIKLGWLYLISRTINVFINTSIYQCRKKD